MKTVDRNIAITFDFILEDEFIKLSKIVSKKVKSKINLNKNNEIPHLTLYMSKYPVKNEQLIESRLDKIAKQAKPFSLKFNSKKCHSSGTIFINPERSEALYKLHEELVDALNPLREGLFNEDELLLPGITESKKRSLREFGMWAVKKLYEPHVSISRVEDLGNGALALSFLPDRIEYEARITTISIVERGHDGTCAKILKTFNLSGK